MKAAKDGDGRTRPEGRRRKRRGGRVKRVRKEKKVEE